MSGPDVRGLRPEDAAEGQAPAVRQGFRVFVGEAAFDQAVARANAQPDREVGGVLVGEVLRDAAGPFLRIDTSIDALHADEQGAELTFTHATWDHIHKELDRLQAKAPSQRVVGWWHSHPGFGVFLSDRDAFICQSFFNLPYQVALVYDPRSREHGLFAWREGKAARARSYWIGAHEHLWDGAREAATPAPATATEAPGTDGGAAASGGFDLWAMVVGALVVALLAGLVGWWVGSRSSADEAARSQLELARAQMAGARDAVQALNGELVRLVRQAVVDKAAVEAVDAAIAELDQALSGAAGADRAKVAKARERLLKLRGDQASAARLLDGLLERSTGASGGGAVVRELGMQRAAVGDLYAELAREVGAKDATRARRLLAAAATVDPRNHARYERVLGELEPGATLPRVERPELASPDAGGSAP